jgi:hypothetical protein
VNTHLSYNLLNRLGPVCAVPLLQRLRLGGEPLQVPPAPCLILAALGGIPRQVILLCRQR